MGALVQVVLSSGRVDKLMKLVEVRGYSFTGEDITLHVSTTNCMINIIATHRGSLVSARKEAMMQWPPTVGQAWATR